MTETLHFAYDATAPDLASLDVKAVHPANLLGTPGAFVVVGASHYVGLPELGYHEVCSCVALDSLDGISSESVWPVTLEPGVERTFAPELDGLAVETLAAVRDLAAFPGPDAADVAHRFGPEAWTTIAVGESGYETYHTYPEYDLALYTRTTVARDERDDESDTSTTKPRP